MEGVFKTGVKFSTSFQWIFRDVGSSCSPRPPSLSIRHECPRERTALPPSSPSFGRSCRCPPSSSGKSVIDGRTETGRDEWHEIGALRIYRSYLAAIYRTCGFSPPARFYRSRSFYFSPPSPSRALSLSLFLPLSHTVITCTTHDRIFFIRFLSLAAVNRTLPRATIYPFPRHFSFIPSIILILRESINIFERERRS